MRFPGRLAAAIAVLEDMDAHRRPVAEALKAWGLGNRFAGAGDRSAIGNLVYDALRRRASHAFRMGGDTPRAILLSVAVREWGETPEGLNAGFAGDKFAPAALTGDELSRLSAPDSLGAAPPAIRADVPEWCAGPLEAAFGPEWIEEAAALAGRPPLDLRVNTLKAAPDRAMKALARLNPDSDSALPGGIRFSAGTRDSRTPNVQTDEAFLKGWVEVQDFGSQIVAALCAPKRAEQVLDLCAGAGGKALALAAHMANRGQIFAHDSDRSRLAPIYDRLKRAGARNVQVRPPGEDALDDLVGKLDRVVVDAPCTGSGTWRRQPSAKWKLTGAQLAERVAEQASILDNAARFVKPGGMLCYITCSVFPEENGGQGAAFLGRHPDFAVVPGNGLWMAEYSGTRLRARFTPEGGIQLTPRLTGTDGFYFLALRRGA